MSDILFRELTKFVILMLIVFRSRETGEDNGKIKKINALQS